MSRHSKSHSIYANHTHVYCVDICLTQRFLDAVLVGDFNRDQSRIDLVKQNLMRSKRNSPLRYDSTVTLFYPETPIINMLYPAIRLSSPLRDKTHRKF